MFDQDVGDRISQGAHPMGSESQRATSANPAELVNDRLDDLAWG
jgi:hypothetical protein